MRKPDPGWTFMVNWGPTGGWYYARSGRQFRICLGRLAITWFNSDIDPILWDWAERYPG